MVQQLEYIKNTIEKCSDDKYSIMELHKSLEPVAEKYSIGLITAKLFCDPPKSEIVYENKKIKISKEPVSFNCKVDMYDASVCCYMEEGGKISEEDKDFIVLLCRVINCVLTQKIYSGFSKQLFYHDYTTGLPNINALKKFAQELNQTGEITEYNALLMNIKSTNYLNKKVGYDGVTNIIKSYVNIINEHLCCREIIAKINEDSFFLLIKKEKTDKIIEIADGKSVDCFLDGKNYTFNVQSRLGIYELADTVFDFESVFRSLTSAMNYARNISHVDVIRCSEELDRHILQVVGYTQLFKESLDKGEFFVVFQPKVLTTDNTLYGAEALVRWHRDGEIIMPSSFISTLEREHLVCRLDWYVLEHTCMYIQKWIDDGLVPVRISVNFSNDHLLEQNVAGRIEEIVDKYNVPHEYIEIEITETVDSEDITKLFDFVSALREMGFSVAIDDFGIGYSSLHLLNSVTVDVLKIDKAFVNRITEEENKKERIIIRNIINMAIQLGIEVVAEGVETASQIETLKKLSCYRIQGFIFDKPLSEENFTLRLTKKKY